LTDLTLALATTDSDSKVVGYIADVNFDVTDSWKRFVDTVVIVP
jgi:hypothetical protein